MGITLSYSNSQVESWIKKVINAGFEIGVHGIEYDDFENMKCEYNKFKSVSGLDMFGIRMHYLRTNKNTLNILSKVGYRFDSSIYSLSAPQKVGNLIEFPLTIMDVRIMYLEDRLKTVSLKEAQEETKKRISQAVQLQLPYLTILFHDRYFGKAFLKWQEWYIWLIEYLFSNGVEFISFSEACKECI